MMANSLLPDMDVLEVATGTGFIALKIAPFVRHAEATDFPLVYFKHIRPNKTPGQNEQRTTFFRL